MKKLNFIMGLVLVLFASLFVASCNNDDEESLEQEFAHVLDNHGVAYSFSDNGNCFGDGGGIDQAAFNNMFIGHGWKHYATWEIDKNGKRKSAEYYSNMLGLAPENYYFDSDTKLTTYCRSDISGGAVKKNEVTYTYNDNYNGTSRTVLLLDNNEYIQDVRRSTKFLHGSSVGNKSRWNNRLWCFYLCADDRQRTEGYAG